MFDDTLISEAIEEELGISDQVATAASDVANYVLDNVKTQQKHKIKPGISTNTFKFSRKIFGQAVNFQIRNIYFSDTKEYFAYRKQYSKEANRYSADTNTIHIEVDYINGWHDRETLEGSLQHELEHLFQNVSAGYALNKTNQYKTASANFSNNQSAIRLVSQMIYFSEEREIYAFANQAYQYLIDNRINPRENIVNTKLYKAYTVLKKGVSFLEQNKDNEKLERLLSQFDTSFQRLYEHCQWAVKEYAKYIGRVIVKSEKDRIAKGVSEGNVYDF